MRPAGTSTLLALFLGVVLFACVPCGCGQRFGRVDASEGDVPADIRLPGPAVVVAEYMPARIAVHPLSRFEGVGGERRAVVDVQVVDAFGHDVKWPGVLRVEVSPTDSFASSAVRWLDLTDGEVNARVFDTISRCYAVRVPAPGTGSLNVRVRWLQGDSEGRVLALEAQGQLTSGK